MSTKSDSFVKKIGHSYSPKRIPAQSHLSTENVRFSFILFSDFLSDSCITGVGSLGQEVCPSFALRPLADLTGKVYIFILSPFHVHPGVALASVNPPKCDDSVNDVVITLAYKTIPQSTIKISITK